ncbi:MAG: L,D-transpeptidase family protein, partial [Pseudomonadota bacterium]
QAVAEAAWQDRDIAAFYRGRNYEPVWTVEGDKHRLRAFLAALKRAPDHGLPIRRYDPAEITATLAAVETDRDRGFAEVATTKKFLLYARDIRTGVLVPGEIDPGIVRQVPALDRLQLLQDFVATAPRGFFRSLPPNDPEYARLLKEKRILQAAIDLGGWGPKIGRGSALRPDGMGGRVIALRNRLIRMGYLKKSASGVYDATLQDAVKRFQHDHGLTADGVAGKSTIAEVNVGPEERMRQIVVALERRRWTNQPLGDRHILVNMADFRAYVMDRGKVTFQTRTVVGKNTFDRRTPEFSDRMTHMVINPTWNVPRSIAIKEYLPAFQRNRAAHGYLQLVDGRGNTVDRAHVDFSQYNEHSFPFDLKQPPSQSNALGRVKFMFPNKYNIYLHDTPAKSLFSREVRAYSHGCVRLHKPFEFAYTLLARQMLDEQTYFRRVLATRKETVVDLEEPVPVHLVYRTAWVPAKGRVSYRRDIYGRDARIFAAMARTGVALRGAES